MSAGVVEACVGLSFAVLAMAYGLQAAGVDVGSMSRRPLARGLLLPYRILGRAMIFLAGLLGREPARDVPADGIVLGRLPFERERAAPRREGIDAVLCLCWEFPGLAADGGLETARVAMLDGAPPTRRQLDEAVERVARWRAEGRCVLIHRAQGHGRTATVAAASLVRRGVASDARAVLAAVRAARPRARPSAAQTAALERFVESQRAR
ncbi:hypothetical protein [Paludisphaera sp.]|uniref:protein-tyrosine phosphatase family protein n=1 Tax=Paludisphaera sp. TaxID=2017432 RepID=UPI00301BB3E9